MLLSPANTGLAVMAFCEGQVLLVSHLSGYCIAGAGMAFSILPQDTPASLKML